MQMNRQTQLAMKHEDERNKLHHTIEMGKAEAKKMAQAVHDMTEKLRSEEEGKKVYIYVHMRTLHTYVYIYVCVYVCMYI